MKVNQNLDDQDLIELILSRKQQNLALNLLYKRHYGLLENYVLQNSGNSEDAADVIQEVMLVFVQIITQGKFRGESTIKSLLYNICKNLWISELRRRKSTFVRHEKYEIESEKTELDISESIARTENLKYIMKVFNQLGEKCKKVLQLFYYEELTMKEVREKLNYSSEQVLRNKKYKCLKSLIQKTQSSPQIYKNLQKALRHE